MKRIVWLASYPKSGNTWMRLLLAAYQHPRDRAFELSDAFGITRSESLRKEFALLANHSDDPDGLNLTEDDLLPLRRQVQERLAARVSPPAVVKTHNAFVTVKGFPIIRAEVTLGAIYVVRNPLDIVDSFADHFGVSKDQVIVSMNDPRHRIGAPAEKMVTQYLHTWSGHVRSWLDQPLFPAHVVRYEDLLDHPQMVLRNVITFLGWRVDVDRLRQAVAETHFEKLQQRESAQGFSEISKRSKSGTFFRSGTSSHWKRSLSTQQISRVVDDHHVVMQQLDYLIDQNGLRHGKSS